MIRRVSSLSMTALLIACARAAAPAPDAGETSELRTRRNLAVTSERVSASSSRIWKAMPSAFKALGYEGKASATEEMTFVTPPLRITGRLYDDELNSKYLDCGRTPAGGLAADLYGVTFAVFVKVVPVVADASMIEARIDGVARTRNETSGRNRCFGTGKLEKVFIDAIKRSLGG